MKRIPIENGNRRGTGAAAFLAAILLLLALATPSLAESLPVDYSAAESWVSRPDGTDGLCADVFFLLPTVNMKDTSVGNEDITNERAASRYWKTLNMEKGVFDGVASVYAPYYRQKTLGVYLARADAAVYSDVAYRDVRDAFAWYLNNKDPEKPFFLFGFSQGAEMGLRLMKDYGGEPSVADRLIAAYLIGQSITADDLAACPWLAMARGETDTGVIVSFECVSEETRVTGPKAIAINPLNWRTDSTPALPEENLGFVQADTAGAVVREIANFCGAYLNETTGMLIATGIENPQEWAAAGLDFLPDGSYHLYELNFFYNNLRENIAKRFEAMAQSAR